MPSPRMALQRGRGAARALLAGAASVLVLAVAAVPGARAAIGTRPQAAVGTRPQAAVLIDHLCAQTIGGNEEDRLFGIISIAVRATIKYVGAVYSPDLIDDAVQNSLLTLTSDCPALEAAKDSDRLGQLVAIVSKQTVDLIRTGGERYSKKQIDDASAADLSEELSSREIETWLNGLAPRERAVALFLYADNIDTAKVAVAVGIPPAAAVKAIANAKSKLLSYVREDNAATSDPPDSGPTMSFSPLGPDLATLMTRPGAVHVTGISSAIYAGWSLLATVTGVPQDRAIEVPVPFMLLPNTPDKKRMIVVGIAEISSDTSSGDSGSGDNGEPRRFLLKAYAIDGDRDGSALADGFHLGATTITDPQAMTVLDARGLADIDKTRCLDALYGTGPAPGLCPGQAAAETVAGPPTLPRVAEPPASRTVAGADSNRTVNGADSDRTVDGAASDRTVDGAASDRTVNGAGSDQTMDGADSGQTVDGGDSGQTVDGADSDQTDAEAETASARRKETAEEAMPPSLGPPPTSQERSGQAP